MSIDYLPNDLKTLWKELDTNFSPISLDELWKQAEELQKGVRRRSLIGTSATWVGIAGFSACFFIFPNMWLRMGSALIVLGLVYMLVQLRMRRATTIPDVGQTECIQFYRAELERQRDFHQGRWFWSRVFANLPASLIFFTGLAQFYPKSVTFIWLEVAAVLILSVISVPLNLRLARKYQRRIDALNAPGGNS